jgi:hypothetical protein
LSSGLGYRVAQRIVGPGIVAPHIAWDSAPVHMTADEALAAGPESDSAIREAREFLADMLMDGPKPATTINQLAEERGISNALPGKKGDGRGVDQGRVRRRLGIESAEVVSEDCQRRLPLSILAVFVLSSSILKYIREGCQ